MYKCIGVGDGKRVRQIYPLFRSVRYREYSKTSRKADMAPLFSESFSIPNSYKICTFLPQESGQIPWFRGVRYLEILQVKPS